MLQVYRFFKIILTVEKSRATITQILFQLVKIHGNIKVLCMRPMTFLWTYLIIYRIIHNDLRLMVSAELSEDIYLKIATQYIFRHGMGMEFWVEYI